MVCLAIGAVAPILSMGHTIYLSIDQWPQYATSRRMWKIWPDFYLYKDRIKTYDCPLTELEERRPNGKRKKWNWEYLFGMEPDKKIFYRFLAPSKGKGSDATEGE